VGSSGGRDIAPAKQTSVTPAPSVVEKRAEAFEARRDPARAAERLHVDAREGHHMGGRPVQKQPGSARFARDDRPRAHAAQPGVR
jgi:hypothetical protein